MATTALFLTACLVSATAFHSSCRSTFRLRRPTSRLAHPMHCTVSVDPKPEGLSSGPVSFDKFDYTACWYPVSWARDLPPNKPTKVTVFDTDYVIARVSRVGGAGEEEEVVAMLDRCPHKSAALSEGRVTAAGRFQCAYHGWSFDGKSGECVEIPQVLTAGAAPPPISGRACGTAVPATVVQGMVWLFPGGDALAALAAPPPPTIPEMDQPDFRTTPAVRDFPVDWSILLENIMDPDHGLFAHGSSGFDRYSASQQFPQSIEEQVTHGGRGWTITSKVAAAEKLIPLDKVRRGEGAAAAATSDVPIAVTTFTAPSHVVMGRRDRLTDSTGFMTAFWVCPVGTGRSRFMSASISRAPIGVPRWMVSIFLNNFLDQDTFLLATQQTAVLSKEAEAVWAAVLEQGGPSEASLTPVRVRSQLYAYRSPAEKLAVRVGALWDSTLHRAPQRHRTLLHLERSGALSRCPPREVVLDRATQHTAICPESQRVVRNCQRMGAVSMAAAALAIAVKAAACMAVVSAGVAAPGIATRVNKLLKPWVAGGLLTLLTATWWLSRKIASEFRFKYSSALRDRDLGNIPKVWADC